MVKMNRVDHIKKTAWGYLVIILLTSCAGSTIKPTQMMASPIRAITPTLAISERVVPLVQTKIPSLVPSNTPRVVKTIAPTLVPEMTEERFKQLLQHNSKCDLPCWWEIRPGTTTLDEARNLLYAIEGSNYNDFKAGYKQEDGTLQFSGGGGFGINKKSVQTVIYLGVKKDVVVNLHISGESTVNEKVFKRVWDLYSPDQILKVYGVPDQLYVDIDVQGYAGGPKGNLRSYELILDYSSQNIRFLYYGNAELVREIINVCPSYSPNGDLASEINIYLGELSPVIHSKRDEGRLTFEQATGRKLRTILQADGELIDPFCFTSQRNVWP
jgi:hypothetical protein